MFWLPLDLMIGAQAQSLNAVLVSNDQAFKHMADLRVDDWLLAAPPDLL
jgi:predicted nucleic acid-binding protein